MQVLNKINLYLNRLLVACGGVCLVAMVVLTCANIAGRAVWLPLRGTFELMGFMGAVVAAFALGYTHMHRGHIAVSVLVNTFAQRTQRALATINDVLGVVFFTVVAWQMGKKALVLAHTGEVTETLRIIYYPFTYAVALGFAVLALVFLLDLLKTVLPAGEDKS
jgi:TRAP-type C4-dicarboxylate transport system permease small subunit